MSISNLYSEYAELEAQEKAIKLKKEQLRPHITKMMVDEGIETLDIGIGKFSVSKRKVWQYPESVLEAEEAFKSAKAKAESTGEATYQEVDSLRYTSAKL